MFDAGTPVGTDSSLTICCPKWLIRDREKNPRIDAGLRKKCPSARNPLQVYLARSAPFANVYWLAPFWTNVARPAGRPAVLVRTSTRLNQIFSVLFVLTMGACGNLGGCGACGAVQPLPGGKLPAGQTIEGG